MLAITFVFALVFALPIRKAIEQKRGRDWVASQRGHVHFGRKYDTSDPGLLVGLLGIDLFNPVCGVTLDCEELADLTPITQLSSLETLEINIYMASNIDLSPLGDLPRLQELHFTRWSGIDRERLDELREMLPNVKIHSEVHPDENPPKALPAP
jgi:hypothetical protein